MAPSTTLDSATSADLLEKLRLLAAGAENFYGFGPGAALRTTGRLFVDAGHGLPSDLNSLLLDVIRGANGVQQLFKQGAVFGFMTDEARILCKAACDTPASYWRVVNAAAARATAPKLTLDDIRAALAELGTDPDSLDTSAVREYWVA